MSVKSKLPARARQAQRIVVVLALAGVLAACGKDEPAGPAATAPAPGTQAAAPPPPAVSETVAAMGADQLREAASAALREQRLYAPAGNNAMEYYLALRDKAPNDPAVASALTDLMPYALIATEQSIGREDFTEAQRLYALMEKTDAKAPALPRLKQTIAAQQEAVAQRAEQEEARSEEEARRQAELETERREEQQRAQQQAAAQLAQQQAAEREAEQQAAERREAEQRQAAAQPATQPAAPAPSAPPPSPARATVSDLTPISTPQPRYPPAAARRQQSGEVQIEFTVGTDGSVTSARVVRANPPRVFDREALSAVERWRFQPIGSPVTTRRTFNFAPGG
jgi:protein TonB